jgi:Helix-turn-helix domain
MVIRKAYRYRLYPTHSQAEVLDRILIALPGPLQCGAVPAG